MKKALLFFFLTYLSVYNCANRQNTNEIKGILDKVSPDGIKGRMSFLADDLLEGRQPGVSFPLFHTSQK